MTKKNGTKRSLLMSALALVLCLSMLVGSTFAWFTDSVTSGNNKVQAGKLDVNLYQWTAADVSAEITNSSAPLFGGDITWEPGMTHVVYLSLKNEGTLALKYKVDINVVNPEGGKNLYEVMEYAIYPDAKFAEVTSWATGTDVDLGVNDTTAIDVPMAPNDEHFFALAVHMKEEADNDYQGGAVEFDIKVEATQMTAEKDAFDSDQYDAGATYDAHDWPIRATGSATVDANSTEATVVTVKDVINPGTNYAGKVATVTVPAEAVGDGVQNIEVAIAETKTDENFTVTAGSETITYDITVEGLKDGNTEPVKVQLFIDEKLDPDTVKVYHHEGDTVSEVSDTTYNPHTGYVTFNSASFSPFTVVFDADSVYVAPPVGPDDLPRASVVRVKEHENTNLEWGEFGSWSPNPAVNPDPMLEAAYTFSCTETLEQAEQNPYGYWYCDFYVMLDKPLGANQIFLGGNYGSFGWVGFHNGDITLAENEPLPLLGSAGAPWTYVDIVQNVGTFTCGVSDVDDALSGATFTVMLRLTNPENEDEYYNVATINYTF